MENDKKEMTVVEILDQVKKESAAAGHKGE